MSSPSLEQLITSHRTTLLQLYTSLSPQPQPLVNSHFDALQQLLDAQIAQQVQSTTDELARVEQVLSERWAKVTDWRAALGEPVGAVKTKADGPLLTLVDEVDQVIEGMRSRMQQRGEAIVELQRRLSAFIEVVGREWLAVELEDWEKGWEGLDLRLERMSSLERECLRCETEIVSAVFPACWLESLPRPFIAIAEADRPPSLAQAHRRDLLALHLNEIFALRSELGIHQTTGTNTSPSSSSTGPRASLTGEIPLADPLDEAILSHLGVGEEREKKEMLATSENLARVEAKRKWVRLSPHFLSPFLSLWEPPCSHSRTRSSRRRRPLATLRSKLRTISSTRSGPCSAFPSSRWSNLSTVGWGVPWTSSTL